MAQLHPLGQPFGSQHRIINTPRPNINPYEMQQQQQQQQALNMLAQSISQNMVESGQRKLQQEDLAAVQGFQKQQQQFNEQQRSEAGLGEAINGLPPGAGLQDVAGVMQDKWMGQQPQSRIEKPVMPEFGSKAFRIAQMGAAIQGQFGGNPYTLPRGAQRRGANNELLAEAPAVTSRDYKPEVVTYKTKGGKIKKAAVPVDKLEAFSNKVIAAGGKILYGSSGSSKGDPYDKLMAGNKEPDRKLDSGYMEIVKQQPRETVKKKGFDDKRYGQEAYDAAADKVIENYGDINDFNRWWDESAAKSTAGYRKFQPIVKKRKAGSTKTTINKKDPLGLGF